MISAADLPDTIPLFPLPGAIVLPRAFLPLRIFEPRYLAMLDDVLKSKHRLIGMIQPNPADDDALHSVGCAGRVTGFQEAEDGRYLVTLTGVSRFAILDEEEGFTPYRRANVDWSDYHGDLTKQDHDSGFNRDRMLPLLRRYLKHMDLSTDWESLAQAGDELIVNSLSMMLPFDVEDKQALLEAPTLTARHDILSTLMEFALHNDGAGDKLQ